MEIFNAPQKTNWISTYDGRIKKVLYVVVIILIINSIWEVFNNWGIRDYYKLFCISVFPNILMLLIMFVPQTFNKYIGFNLHKVMSIIWILWSMLSILYIIVYPEDSHTKELLMWEIPDKIFGLCFLLCLWIINDFKKFNKDDVLAR